MADLECAIDLLAALDGAGATEAEQIEYVAALEKVKGALAAAQARVTDNLARARAASEAQRGVPPARRCRGLSAEIALARRTSPPTVHVIWAWPGRWSARCRTPTTCWPAARSANGAPP